jgi:hypothetical protein
VNGRGNVCLIDTVDSGAHYLVKGAAADVAGRLERANQREFVTFDLAQRGDRTVHVCASHVIAVLDPA